MTLKNDDLFLVNRGGTSFKTEYGIVKENILEDSNVIVSDKAPTGAEEGDLWYNSEDGRLYVWYVNETTGVVTSLSIRNGGSGYTAIATDVETNGGSGFGLTVDIEPGLGGNLANPTVNKGGHGYTVGDYIVVTGAGHQNGTLNVTAVNAVSVGQWVDASPDGGSQSLWTRTGTTLEPATANDNVDLGTGNLSADNVTLTGDINAGNARFRGSVTYPLRYENRSSDGKVTMQSTTSTLEVRTTQTDPSIFAPIQVKSDCPDDRIDGGGTTVYQVRADGSVYLGGTLPASPNITLNANGAASFIAPASATTLHLYQNSSPNDNNIQEWNRGAPGAFTRVARMNNQGTLYLTNTTPQQNTSERRLKENITPVDPDKAWETIKSVPFYAYNFIGSDQSNVVYGPMAGEVPVEMQIETDQSDDEGVIRTYDNGMLQARLYVALQTALTRIEALEAKVQQLEGGN